MAALSLPDFTTWLLSDVHTALAGESEWAGLKISVIETGPPAKKPRLPKPGHKVRPDAEPKRDFQATRPGEWRVLRARLAAGEIELLVAREELRALNRDQDSD
jgi:hypothetical protein